VTRDGRGYPLAANRHDDCAASAIRRSDASYQNVLRIRKPNIRGVTLHRQHTQIANFFFAAVFVFVQSRALSESAASRDQYSFDVVL
jgi:hypothetical protein